jgi:hypothetical protein
VQDESLIDEMRAALKGDRERAEARSRIPGADEHRSHAASVEKDDRAREGLLVRLGLRRRRFASPGAAFRAPTDV